MSIFYWSEIYPGHYDREPIFPPLPSDDYEPINAHLTEGDWPQSDDRDEAPAWTLTNEPLTTDPYEWKRERNGQD